MMTITHQTERGRIPPQMSEREYGAFSTFTATQVTTLHTTAVPIVDAEGSGTVILPHLIYVRYDYDTAAFGAIAAGDDINIRYSDSASTAIATVETTGFLDQTPSSPAHIIRVREPAIANINANAGVDITSLSNTGIEVQLGGAVTGGGSSTLKFRIYYRVLAV